MLVTAASASAFTPQNALYPKQWYLAQDHAFDAWPAPPTFQPVRVAIIDSGVDCSLPDFQGQIVLKRSFVGGDACSDDDGHGTIVAGEIAAGLDATGIVGLAYTAQLVVAKVVTSDGAIPLKAEADAIRWAVDVGHAQVVNLSLGGVRDPPDPARDTYSSREADAVAYAVSKGAVVVAAAGNADDAYATPWLYASWPAALPHVIGVAALTRSGDVPDFSDRDPTYVDLAAPGVDIYSTFPADLTAQQQGCEPQGYTDCATGDYAHPDGTSFAAPQVSAAAAVLLGIDPTLTSSQVTSILEHSADDVNASNGCAACPTGRDEYTGWGRLDVEQAVAAVNAGAIPPSDALEPNDKLSQAKKLWGRRPDVRATLDFWNDRVDWYRVRLDKGQWLQARAQARWSGARVRLTLWEPGTPTILHGNARTRRAAQGGHPGASQHFSYRVPKADWYYVEVGLVRPGAGAYTLELSKLRPARAPAA